MSNEIRCDWNEYHRLVEHLGLTIYKSGWEFDIVLCLARGGLVAGNILCRIFDRPLAVLSTSSYREAIGTVQGELAIAQSITITEGELAGRILLVDDLIDSGLTLNEVKKHIAKQFPKVTEVRSAVLWKKGTAQAEPDYCVEDLSGNPWIHQPFEIYDSLDPEQLESWIKRDL